MLSGPLAVVLLGSEALEISHLSLQGADALPLFVHDLLQREEFLGRILLGALWSLAVLVPAGLLLAVRPHYLDNRTDRLVRRWWTHRYWGATVLLLLGGSLILLIEVVGTSAIGPMLLVIALVSSVGHAIGYVGIASFVLEDLRTRVLCGAALAGVVGCFPLLALGGLVIVVPYGLGVVLCDWWVAYSARNSLA